MTRSGHCSSIVIFTVVNGVNAELSAYFFSTTPFTVDGGGNRVGATGFTGTVTSGTSFSVAQVSEPSTLLLVAISLIALGRKKAMYAS